MRNYDLIVFDWDGTIIDSTGLIADCIQHAARDLQLRVPTVAEAKYIIGLGLLQSTGTLFPELSPADRARFAVRFREHYVPRDHEAPLYPGIVELLESLAAPERFLAVATGKPRAGLERAFAHTGLKAHFHYSRCADEGFAKPHPDMLLKLMDFTGASPQRTLMIGDTSHDLQLAQNAGVAAVAVTYGAHPAEVLAGHRARARVDSVTALAAWLAANG
ncbi:MAG TPA: HAD-IA family hydrolase [Usitatibacteraceae bacterium]